MSGRCGFVARRIHILLFVGPYGNGNTYTFKAMAAKSERKAYVLEATKLMNNMYAAPLVLAQVLDSIGRQLGACLLIDKADALLCDCQPVADSQSVELRKTRDMLSRFLASPDGLSAVENPNCNTTACAVWQLACARFIC